MKRTLLILLVLAIGGGAAMAQFKQAPLPYKYSALEPYIDSTTMYIHFNMHHATYIKNLNAALEKYPQYYQKTIPELLKELDKLPAEIQTAVRNQGGGSYNHTLFWNLM